MAHTLSANKRIRQTAKRRERNRDRKKVVRQEVKKVITLIAKGDQAGATAELKIAAKILDRTATRGAIHPNTAARRKSRLAKKLNALKKAAAGAKA